MFSGNLQNSQHSRFFRQNPDDQTFVPDYSAFAFLGGDGKKIRYELNEDVYVDTTAYLKSGLLIGKSHSFTGKPLAIYIWDAATGKLLHQFNEERIVNTIFAINSTVAAIMYFQDGIEFWDFSTPNKPKKLVQIDPQENEIVYQACLLSKHIVYFTARDRLKTGRKQQYRLNVLTLPPQTVDKEYTPAQFAIDVTEQCYSGVISCGNTLLLPINENEVLLFAEDKMYIYNISSSQNTTPQKYFTYPESQSYLNSLLLNDGKLATVFCPVLSKTFTLSLWELAKPSEVALQKTIALPRMDSTQGIRTLFQDPQGKIVLITNDCYQNRLLVVDPYANPLVMNIYINNTALTLYDIKLTESGEQLLTSRNGELTACIIPQKAALKLSSNITSHCQDEIADLTEKRKPKGFKK